jgi:nicotinate phosphoribosyltransferase
MNGVYKLVALRVNKRQEDDDDSEFRASDQTMLLYKLKTSPGKRTYPGPKQIQRIIKNKNISRDIIVLEDEETSSSLGIPLLRKIFDNGQLIYEMPPIEKIQQYCLEQIELLPTQFKDLDYVPREYPVTYSDKLKSITRGLYPN